jgi:recombination protein RecA
LGRAHERERERRREEVLTLFLFPPPLSHSSRRETISTGALTLDVALGGGLPKGRIVEIYGPESSGKTTIALHAIAEVQKNGGRAALIDAEHAFDPIYAAALGIKLPELLISQPESGEMALEIVDQLVRSDSFDLVAVDSVAALTPKAELEGEIGQATIGLQARLLSAALRKVAANASKSGTTILMLNQLRMKIGVLYGNPEVTPGGNALKFYASARVDVRRKAALDPPSGGAASGINASASPGIRVRAKVVKNKCAPPYRVAEFDILFNSGINNTGCVLEAAEGVGVVERKGAWFYLASDGTRLGQGKDKASAVLEADPKLRAKVEKETRERLDGRMAKKGGGSVVPVASSADDDGDEEEIDEEALGAAEVGSATLEAAAGGGGGAGAASADEEDDAA